MDANAPAVPAALRRWFVVHFAVDYAFAIPLFLWPEPTLQLFGWAVVDPVATRLVAAALFGIGGASLFARDADAGAFRALLDLKLVWSGTAVLGLAWSAATGGPPMAWAFAATFAAFGGLWGVYRARLT